MFVINATDYAPVTPVTPPCDIIPIFIGYKGENHARCLIFDLTDCIEEFGDGSFAISFMRHGDAQPYIVTDTDSLETTAIWEINSADTAVEGYGMVQLQYIVGDTVCKTAMYRTITFDSNESAGDVPDPYENLLDQIAAYAAAAQASARSAAQSAANASGEADRIIANTAEVVGDWLDDNIGEISGYVIDKSLTVSDAAADAEVTGTWVRGSYITDTASGAVASFPDGADGVPVKNLSVSVQAQQSGTGDPSPDNIRAITGWTQANVTRTAKNLLSNDVFSSDGKQGLTYTYNADGTMTVSGTASANSYAASSWVSFPVDVIVNGVPVDGSGNVINQGIYIQVYTGAAGTGGDVHANNTSLVIPANTPFMIRLRINSGIAISGSVLFTPMVRVATDTDYSFEPYNGTTYTVSFGSAGTVYGGTLDVTTGVLTVTKQYKTLNGTESFNLNATGSTTYVYRLLSAMTVPNKLDQICTHFKFDDNANSAADSRANTFVQGTSGSLFFQTTSSIATTADGFKTWLATQYSNGTPVTYVANITPETYVLTPQQIETLFGNNNVWADCGATDVTYRADPRLYLEKLTNPDSDMTADANIASGQYFMVGNRLYLATSAISLGASIVPGTNCTATDLASALNAINS